METKAEIRVRMRAVRAAVVDVATRSAALWEALAARPEYVDAATVMAYVSMAGEPDTAPLFDRLARDAKMVVLPRIVGGMIEAAYPGDRLLPGPLRIPSPTGTAVDPATIGLVLVPGLAFTVSGGRLGHGKAYYDRFLAGLDAVTIGVCFAEQVVAHVPMEAHDRWLDAVLIA